MSTYYNEIDPYAAAWLRNLISAGHLPAGEVDERSIVDVSPDDLRRFRQCHFFAGIGGWALAARLAGWPEDRDLWTGSAPCQPFSVAGKGAGADDSRHLWPHYFRLIDACRPAVAMGEQVAAAVGKHWLDGVFADLEGIGYACGAVVVPACAVDAPHRRDRLWFVAHSDGLYAQGFVGSCADPQERSFARERPAGSLRTCGSALAHADCDTCRQGDSLAGRRADGSGAGQVAGPSGSGNGPMADAYQPRASEPWQQPRRQLSGPCGDSGSRDGAWITGHDGKARRFEPGIRLLAHGVPARVGKLRAYGNAIVPQVAAEVIAAYMEAA